MGDQIRNIRRKKHLTDKIGQVLFLYISPMHQMTTRAVKVTRVSMVTP